MYEISAIKHRLVSRTRRAPTRHACMHAIPFDTRDGARWDATTQKTKGQ